jgi:hypothetical protein
MAERLGLVINYYNPTQSATLRVQTEFCALKALESKDHSIVVKVVVSDGTGVIDEELQVRLAALGVRYVASDKPLGFAQGYNQGLRFFSEQVNPPPLLATCANDIFCDSPTLPALAHSLLTDPFVGCAMPYLSQSDYLTQNDWVYKYYREASAMTYNLNVFRTKDLVEVGYVPEAFTGYYNDLATMIELHRRGLKVVLVNGGNVVHLGRATVSAGSMAKAEKDRETFRKLYPAESREGPSAIKQEVIAAGKWNRFWFYWQSRGPAGWQRWLTELGRLGLQIERLIQNIKKPQV